MTSDPEPQDGAAGSAGLGYSLHVPERPVAGLLVAVHGRSRQAAEMLQAFRPHADARRWALLVPTFAAPPFDDYQRLGREGRP